MADASGGEPARGSLESLLEPSLATAAPEALYSIRAGFLVAFFGGVHAAAVFGALNARRMRRLAEDGWICAVVALAWVGVLGWTGYAMERGRIPGWLEVMGSASRTVGNAGRLLALGLFGLLYLRRRAMFKAQALTGVEAPSPWPAGLASIAVSIAVSVLSFGIGRWLGRG